MKRDDLVEKTNDSFPFWSEAGKETQRDAEAELMGQALQVVKEELVQFASRPQFQAKLRLAFGEELETNQAEALAQAWQARDFGVIPPLEVRSAAELGGANGAYARATNTIYLSREFLAANQMNHAAISQVLLEEMGHAIDVFFNQSESGIKPALKQKFRLI